MQIVGSGFSHVQMLSSSPSRNHLQAQASHKIKFLHPPQALCISCVMGILCLPDAGGCAVIMLYMENFSFPHNVVFTLWNCPKRNCCLLHWETSVTYVSRGNVYSGASYTFTGCFRVWKWCSVGGWSPFSMHTVGLIGIRPACGSIWEKQDYRYLSHT